MENGVKGLTVTFDSFDEVMTREMMEYVRVILEDPWVGHHNYVESLKDVDSLLRVVECICSSEWGPYMEAIKPEYDKLVELAYPPLSHTDLDITVTNIRDLPDGGANIEYEASPKMKEFLMGVGLQKIIMDHVEAEKPEPKQEEYYSGYITDYEVPGWQYWGADK